MFVFGVHEPVERALQDEHRGVLVDHRRALFPADVGRDQLALDRGGGQPLVPERDRQIGEFGEVAREGAGGLRAGSFAAVHVERQAEHETNAATFGGESQHTFGIEGEGFAGNRFHAGGEPAVGVRGGDADGLGADIEAEQSAAQRQVRGGLAHFDDGGRHETTFPCLGDAPQALTLA